MYWEFLFSLFVGAFVAPMLFSFMIMPFLMGFGALARRDRAPLPGHVVMGTAVVAQLYFWVGWAAFCAVITVLTTSDTSISAGWLYYVTAFIFLVMPIGYLRTQEERGAKDQAEARNIQRGSNFYDVVTIVAFICFCLFPTATVPPYGWFLQFLA